MELVIGEPVRQWYHREKYKLVVACKKGETEKLFYKTLYALQGDIDRYKEFLSLLLQCKDQPLPFDVIYRKIIGIEDKYNLDIISQLTQNGVGIHHWNIVPTLFKISFIDAQGQERHVSLQ